MDQDNALALGRDARILARKSWTAYIRVVFLGMGSWLLKSYTVRIGHRFTKANEIVMTHMASGHQAVMTVNAMHQELVRAGRLA